MLSFQDWIDAVLFRWKMIAVTTVVIILAGVAFIAVTPSSYKATSSLLLDTRAPDPLKDSNADDDKADSNEVIATQVDLINSPSVADLAAAKAGMTKDPKTIAKWRAATDGEQPYHLWLRKRLQKSLSVVPGKNSSVVAIEATAKSPTEAARIANAYANASVASQYRLRTEPAKAYAGWLSQQLEAAKIEVVKSQDALSAFARAKAITNDGDMGSEGTQMAQVATQLASAEARAAAARQQSFEQAQSMGDAERSSGIQDLRSQVALASGRYSNLRAQFGPDYPDVKRAEAELNTLNGQLASAVATTTQAFNAARQAESAAERSAASASEARLRSLAAQQRARVQDLGTNLAQYQRLKNEFQVAQRDYNTLSERLGRMRLQGSIPRTEVQVLSLAAVPIEPDWPKPGLALLLSALIGGLLGCVAAIVLETLYPRVRSGRAIERLLGVRVIGSVSVPALPRPETLRLMAPKEG